MDLIDFYFKNKTKYFVSGSSIAQFDGIVNASSPACRNLITSPPKTQEMFFKRLNPVPKGATDQCVTWNDALTMALSSSFVACCNTTLTYTSMYNLNFFL